MIPWYRNQRCRLAQEGKGCAQGLRLRHHYMLCGALLRVWGRIAAVMADVSSSSYLQIVRLKTKDKKKQVGKWGGGHGIPRERIARYHSPGRHDRVSSLLQASRSPRAAFRAYCRSCG